MRLPRFHSAAGLCLGFLFAIPVLFAGPIPIQKPDAYPAWWFERDVVPRSPSSADEPNPIWPDDYPLADDYAVANLGQLKHMTKLAAAEFRAHLPAPGIGSAISTLLTNWSSGGVGDDYAVLTQGQLKEVVRHFYDRLASHGYTSGPAYWERYPWTWRSNEQSDDDDYAVVNLGQLKHVFSFAPSVLGLSPGPLADLDGDGLPDMWETTHWGNTSQSATSDPDGDGLSNLLAYRLGLNPTNLDHDLDGLSNAAELLRGTDPWRSDTDGDLVNDYNDLFPLDPSRSALPAPSPGDTLPPVITLLHPSGAVLTSSS
jgi:hypothetical protein